MQMPWTYRHRAAIYYGTIATCALLGAGYGAKSELLGVAAVVGLASCGAAALVMRILLDALVALFEIRAALSPRPPAASPPSEA